MLEIVDALHSDAIELAPQLRPIDKLEVEATGNTPEKSLINSFNLPKSRVYSGVDLIESNTYVWCITVS